MSVPVRYAWILRNRCPISGFSWSIQVRFLAGCLGMTRKETHFFRAAERLIVMHKRLSIHGKKREFRSSEECEKR